MRNIGTIGTRPPPTSLPAAGATPVSGSLLGSSSAGAFQRTGASGALSLSSRGFTGLASPSLSSQTTSTLMQEQDVTQQLEQQGHGGGGHGGGMRMVRNLEAEEAAGTEEAQQMKKRKKLQRPGQLEDMVKIVAFDENGNPIMASDEDETQETGRNGRGIWDWL